MKSWCGFGHLHGFSFKAINKDSCVVNRRGTESGSHSNYILPMIIGRLHINWFFKIRLCYAGLLIFENPIQMLRMEAYADKSEINCKPVPLSVNMASELSMRTFFSLSLRRRHCSLLQYMVNVFLSNRLLLFS